MFHSTTHYKYWIFASEEELRRRRYEANQDYIAKCQSRMAHSEGTPPYLTMDEEATLVSYYLTVLADFCRKFKPPMPKCVVSTSIQYFKRFYLNNSVMEHHPKHIMVTCVFLATKIEEFNVTMQQFVNNIKGDRSKASEIVLNNELLLLHRLNYQLTISHPYRPVEGFLIDIKTRYPECNDPERFRVHIDSFLDKSFSTDACFLFTPNQLALLSMIYAAEKVGENLEPYLHILFSNRLEELDPLQRLMKKLNDLMATAAQDNPTREMVKAIETKIEHCQVATSSRHSGNERSVDSSDEESETVSYERYSQYREEQEMMDQEYIQKSGRNRSSD